MRKWLCLVLVAAPAFASPKRNVDVSVTYRRTIVDTSSETDSRDTACVSTKTGNATFTESVQVVAAKVPISGNSISMPMKKEASLSGQAHYDYKAEQHSAGCDGTGDFTGTAHSDADAKDISIQADEDSVMISPTYKDPTSEGTMIDRPKHGPVAKLDGAKLAAAGAGLYSSAVPLNLFTAEQLAIITKANPRFAETAALLAQDGPVVVQTSKGNIDITYTNSETVDLLKNDKPEPKIKKTATRKVVTEVSIHATPSK